jgi:D-alanyl-lipoteichoic acid acyltransferase DltB (MBOAT superfamily)
VNFAQLRFWLLLLEGLTVILVCRAALARWRKDWLPLADKLSLLGLGLTLLFFVSWVTLLIFLAVAVGSYAGLYWIQRYHAQHAFRYVPFLIVLQLTPLLYYKYGDFVANRVFLLGFNSLRDLIIPIGISFYTFQKVAFVIDTLVLKQTLPTFLDYMNFAGFFPQIVAGPIERRRDLLPQMQHFHWRWSAEDLNEGVSWIVLGLFFKCCLADNLATYFNGDSVTNAYLIWFANIIFGLRIYYDFAGYSLIAFGLARFLGVRLTLNFASPYSSTSVAEFWRRWHITLSQWFRDYLYIPVGGGRTRFLVLNIMLVFAISGIWHGAGWNFLLWGLAHGLFLIINRLSPELPGLTALKYPATLLAVFFAWLFFYEVRPGVLATKIETLITPSAYSTRALAAAWQTWPPPLRVVIAGFLSVTFAVLFLEWLSLRWKDEAYLYLRRPSILATLVVLTILLAPDENNGFIYFAF